jgi:plastocyanin
MFLTRILAVGLILAALSSTPARAQEATDGASGDEYVAYTESEPEFFDATPVEPVPEELEAPVLEAMAEPVVEPIIVEPIIEPTPIPTPTPTPMATPSPTPSPTATPVAAAASGRVSAVVVDNRFQPNTLTVAVGTTVTWTNNGSNFHTLSSAEDLFNSGALGGGQTFSYTFQKAGSYTLICRQHLLNGMSGKITVQ